jgi:catechol 2,3-dioxygenase-like lactoylglutathione lyase family enzyme
MAANLFRVILPVEDLERADAFWDRILGLPIDRGVPSRHYIQTGGAILVLVDPSEHGGRHTPNPDRLYFRMPDLAASRAIAQEHGCPDLPTGESSGEVSFCTRDPDGNPFCFIEDAAGSSIPNLCKVILPTTSMERADAFFEELLRIEPDTSIPTRHFFPTESCELALEQRPQAFRPNPEMVYFAVSDLDAAWERAQKLGLEPVGDSQMGEGIQQRVWGERSFYGRDPSGNPICLVDDKTLYTGSP